MTNNKQTKKNPQGRRGRSTARRSIVQWQMTGQRQTRSHNKAPPASSFSGSAPRSRGPFPKRRVVGGDVDLIDVAKLISNPAAEYVRLQRAGLPLLRQAARNQFIEQAEIEAGKDPTFLVARQPGLYRGKVCLPGDPVSPGLSDVEFYPDERHAPVYEKFLRAGTYRGWNELVSLSRGNSRLLFGYQLAFSGLPCAAFGLDPPGADYCGPLAGASPRPARFRRQSWGWDPTPNTRLGFGFPWRTKLAALENYAAGCNHTLLFLDEMSKATEGGS